VDKLNSVIVDFEIARIRMARMLLAPSPDEAAKQSDHSTRRWLMPKRALPNIKAAERPGRR
jgi:methyl-accepting chemotaxis protein